MSNVRIDLKSAENMAPKAYIVINLHKIEQIYVKNGALQNIFGDKKLSPKNIKIFLAIKICCRRISKQVVD